MRFRIYCIALNICLVLTLACFFERPAYGYIDPGSGILAYQAISAFFAGTIFYFRRRIKSLFRPIRYSSAQGKGPTQVGGSGT